MALTKTINPSANYTAPASSFNKGFGNAGLSMKVTVVQDDATPAFNYINSVWQPAVRKAMAQAGAIMKKTVSQTYMTNRMTAFPNSPITVALKNSATPLEESGALRDAMTGNYGVEYNPTKPNQVRVYWDLPESGGTGLFPASRKNDSFEYIWAQEFGSGKMKTRATRIWREGATPEMGGYEFWTIKHTIWALEPRPFFVEGMKKGAQQALAVLVGNLAPIIDNFKNYKAPRLQSGMPVSMAPDIFKLPIGAQALMWYVVPPSSMYKYIGIASDMHGVWDASFNERAVWGYIRQYAYGQGGATRKSMRRKFRRQLWTR
jgi:hypothetical protein